MDLVLPDLHAQGYSLKRQVILNGISRRLDVVLETPEHAWIIELKRGSPNVSEVSRQILDYGRCWDAAYPNRQRSLMVIANSESEQKRRELQAFGIEYRVVSQGKVLEVLSEGQSTELLGECSRLETDDVGRIRFLLSNFAHTTVPVGMRLAAPWTHDSVFYALIQRGHEHKRPWLKNIYVKMFNHRPNCAVLYHPEATTRDGAPLHLNPRSTSWPKDGWKLNDLVSAGAVAYECSDNKGTGRENGNFDHYRIVDWDLFANVLGLDDDRV